MSLRLGACSLSLKGRSSSSSTRGISAGAGAGTMSNTTNSLISSFARSTSKEASPFSTSLIIMSMRSLLLLLFMFARERVSMNKVA